MEPVRLGGRIARDALSLIQDALETSIEAGRLL